MDSLINPKHRHRLIRSNRDNRRRPPDNAPPRAERSLRSRNNPAGSLSRPIRDKCPDSVRSLTRFSSHRLFRGNDLREATYLRCSPRTNR